MSRILKILIILIVVLVLIFLGYYFFFANKKTDVAGQTSGQNTFPTSGENASSTSSNESGSNDENQIIGGGNIAPSQIEVGTYLTDKNGNKLTRISDKPVVSSYVYGEGNLKTTKVRYVEAGTGNIYEYDAIKGTAERISIKTIPKVKEVLWGNQNNLVIRYLEGDKNTLKTFVSTLKPITKFDTVNGTTTEMSLEGSFLPDNIRQIAVSPSGQKIYYLLGYSGFEQSFTDSKPKQMFTSKLKSWLISWPQEDKIVLQTPPSDGIAGYAYSISSKLSQTDSDLTKIIGPINGLSIKYGKEADRFIFSQSSSGNLRTNYSKRGEINGAGFSTLAEKCIFGHKNTKIVYCATPNTLTNAKYPDDWYKGYIHFNDSIFSLETDTGGSYLLLDLNTLLEISVDISSIDLNEDDTNLVFIDKNTSGLWMLDLKGTESI